MYTLWLTHADVWQRATQYCKPIILQLNFSKFGENFLEIKKIDGKYLKYKSWKKKLRLSEN